MNDTPATTARPAPLWRDLREWLALVERHAELHRVTATVDPREELAAITFMGSRQTPSPAFLFERFATNPHGARVLSNMLGASTQRYALALGLDPASRIADLVSATRRLTKSFLPAVYVEGPAPVDEIVLEGSDIDLTQFPVPTFWPRDGGPFIGTGGITITADPASGRINVGCYRQQLLGPRRIGLNCVPGRDGQQDVDAQWAQGKPAEVVAAFGIDPVLFMVSAMKFPPGVSELDAAGGMMGRPVELARGRTVSLPVPARAEIVIEGRMHQGDTEMEGPLGEFHGFYSGAASMKPVIEVTALRMRRNPILNAALMATYPSCENGAHMAIMRSARIMDDLDRMGLPGVKSVYCHPAAASGNCMAVVAIDQRHPGHSGQALALTAQCPTASYYTKWIVAVDADVDPTNLEEVFWAMSTRCNPSADLDILRGAMTFRADPSVPPEDKPFGSKVLVNACTPWKARGKPPHRTHLRESVYSRVRDRWSELGIPTPVPSLDTFDDGA